MRIIQHHFLTSQMNRRQIRRRLSLYSLRIWDFLAGAGQFLESRLSQFHEFIPMKHPMLVQLLLQEDSDIQHVRLGFPPGYSRRLEMPAQG